MFPFNREIVIMEIVYGGIVVLAGQGIDILPQIGPSRG
jgi:hypothetical protein